MWEFALLHLFANIQRGNAVLVVTQNQDTHMTNVSLYSLQFRNRQLCSGDADVSSDGSD